MAYCCSQCSFTAQFESALTMHHQLHHETEASGELPDKLPKLLSEKSKTLPRDPSPTSEFVIYSRKQNKAMGLKLGGKTTSATRLFGKIRAKICKSKSIINQNEDSDHFNDLSARSECTSKALKRECPSRTSAASPVLARETRETFACHLCSFEADRITVLDRHLLNDHKIGLENLLKLVMAKTKDGLNEDNSELYGTHRPYYKLPNEGIEDGEFVIETVTPQIKILRHTATNTDIQWNDIPDLKDNCKMISQELEKIMKSPSRIEKNDLLDKMQTLNECMCKFVNSSNTLKKVLSRDGGGKWHRGRDTGAQDPVLEFGLGELESPRDWERAHSEKLERNRSKHSNKFRTEKSKLSAESYYF